MAKANPETVLLKGDHFRKQREAAGTITPGQLLVLGTGDTVLRHATAHGWHNRWFAVENDIAGDDLDDNYASGEVVQIQAARPGDEIYAFLADGQNVAIGALLSSNGNGDLRAILADSSDVVIEPVAVAMALEALDLSGSPLVDPASRRIKVEVL